MSGENGAIVFVVRSCCHSSLLPRAHEAMPFPAASRRAPIELSSALVPQVVFPIAPARSFACEAVGRALRRLSSLSSFCDSDCAEGGDVFHCRSTGRQPADRGVAPFPFWPAVASNPTLKENSVYTKCFLPLTFSDPCHRRIGPDATRAYLEWCPTRLHTDGPACHAFVTPCCYDFELRY
jgi:hypothetical protein